MTKRFTDVWCSETGHIGVTDNGIDKEFTGSEFKDLLNELNETIERLKQNINELLSVNVEEDLLKENEKLKNKIEKLHDLIFKLRTENAFDRTTEKQSTITAKEFLDKLDKW